MRTFDYSKLREIKWDYEVLDLIVAISNEAGKQELYLKQMPEKMDKLVEIAKIQSTESSNTIEGIVTTNLRFKQLVLEKTTPKNRNEEEIAGYRDVLSLIHENYDVIPMSNNYILQLHKMLYRYTNNRMAGKLKNVQNYISASFPDGHTETLFTPLSPVETPSALDSICNEYNRVIANGSVNPLLVIPVFIHDFLCIHPFNDGNGRMSRLLTTLLLYQNGYQVGKYISLETKIAKHKDLYYEALQQSQVGWHKGKEDILPFMKYLLGTILAAYKDFDDRCMVIEDSGIANEVIQKIVEQMIGRFTKQDIHNQCPYYSVSSVEGSLRNLIHKGIIKREGIGKATYYIRLK